MGMFDWVKFEYECPNCGAELNSFQSKDGDCLIGTIEFWQVNHFYDYCKCGAWVEFNLKRKKHPTIKDYKMSWSRRG